ncbi:GH36-type glycosyl hydrolase domain-containing protein [Pelagibacterium lentulum]|uniref:Glycosyl transferase n=1 Tax=Pelagibacterium lentulum TaxID=2029865 RepID=A0A916VVI7_9HYPH|nr:glucoamylase family protein [Pelagibacterium lentulum]GGA40567.1 glycosyl transferase [Pelagibacterium lentulum]
MNAFFGLPNPFANKPSPWIDPAPVRDELFGVERLEQHAESLALAQSVAARPPRVRSLHRRLDDNAATLLAAYRESAVAVEGDRGVVPAAEWLLDNYHLVEAQIREIREDLPPSYYRQLPKLANGPFVGYPRVFGIAWAFIAHTDSHFDPTTLSRFVAAYQRIQPLTIGELWAVAITLRIVLIENLRRLADQITIGRATRADADALADRLLAVGTESDSGWPISNEPLSERFAAQLAKRLRDQDPATTPAQGWLEQRLAAQGTSIEVAVQHALQRQGSSNVTVRNIVTSMRLISDVDWAELFEGMSLVDARLSAASGFADMDFPTRDLYRSAIEQLARGAPGTELDIAGEAIAAANEARLHAEISTEADRVGDPGFHLIGEGRKVFEARIGFRSPVRLRLSRIPVRFGLAGYLGALALVTMLFFAAGVGLIALLGATWLGMALFALAALLPVTAIAIALVNRAIAGHVGASALPGLELAEGVPHALRTLIAVPTLLTTRADLSEQIERLEVHYLSGSEGEVYFALLADGVDAPQEVMSGDSELIEAAQNAIATLNARHGPGAVGDRFVFLYRRRQFNPGENVWMGWERKRGKLHELNRLLRGVGDTSFAALDSAPPPVPTDVRYVITLDADTVLPRETALRLVGKMAHPLNRPRFDTETGLVVGGYAILQPRVTAALPGRDNGSLFQRIFSSPGGMDPYAGAISDVYQDLFGQGSFAGKGIYDVDAFETALAGRIPDNTLLSHDLLEGIFARAGLASDVELVEDFPARYDVAARRAHRWTRGDWQLLPWIFGKADIGAIGRWKMLDNLRRALIAPFSVLALVLACLLPLPAALAGIALIIMTIAIPALLPVVFSVFPRRGGLHLPHHFVSLVQDAKLAAAQVALKLAFLPDEAWRNLDAIGRTLYRVFISRRNLLEWTTAAQAGRRARLSLLGFYIEMAGGTAVAIALLFGALLIAPGGWPVIVFFAMLWLAAPALALHASRSDDRSFPTRLTDSDAKDLRLIARRTWRFFETFVTPDDNMLPPDNFQESPHPTIAHRTSPTNIGLYLLSTVAAHDFGWAGTLATIERLEASFETLGKLGKFNGHLFNWYDTQDLRTLEPAYVSSVDSGNLAGHLIALANACEEWAGVPITENRTGLIDTLDLALLALANEPGKANSALVATFEEIETLLRSTQSLESASPTLIRLSEKALKAAREADGMETELVFWIGALAETLNQFSRDRTALETDALHVNSRLLALAKAARDMALGMDFAFLLDPDRKLLSIGFSLGDNGLDPSCYDLLASEARLASLFAIAKGDAPTRHWFRLGRTATPIGNGSALVSWSGSMFEYLMPSLVMRAPEKSLLERTNRTIVARQMSYAKDLGVPWGISESAFNARDLEFTYQYSNFGVPDLGLKRGLSANLVIAPYATGLAAMIDPRRANENYARLEASGTLGPYGFYEALDFTPARVPPKEKFAIVRNVMAHHQGMTIVSILNTLLNGRMRARFHREPIIMASELLLAEKLPREVAVAHARAAELKARTGVNVNAVPAVRRIAGTASDNPIATHMLSNGRYAVMVTASGAGYSRWRDIAVTRWREDVTRDDWGAFVYLKDAQTGATWSPSAQPVGSAPGSRSVIFGEDHAEFVCRDGSLTTSMELLVSGEDDGEVRRISLTNAGRRVREIELTSFAELVLAPPASDNAHPAFSKMFVITEYLAEFGALVATRRRRNPSEPEVWAAHFAVVEGEIIGEAQYETDRARFIGRNRTIADPVAIADGHVLSNSVGTVLDPVFSLRQRVRIPPGKVARVAFWTVVASSRERLLELIDSHHDRSAFDRAKTLAWTQAQVQLHHLGTSLVQAADFQRLATPILYADPRFRIPAEALVKGIGAQSGLWVHGISGDLPIVVLRIEDIEDMAQARQLLRAHEYWRMKGLAVDLVIVNERAASYVQDLQTAIETAVRTSQSRPRFGEQPADGTVHVLRADMMASESHDLIYAVARIVLLARHGPIADQLARLAVPPTTTNAAPVPGAGQTVGENVAIPTGLEFFNGLGGFGKNGTEYVTVLEDGHSTPAPWINVIANADFGFQASTDGSGYTWAQNSRENQLTPWSNDPVADPNGEVIYIRDEENGALWGPTAQPIRDAGRYVARHGFGYSSFSHRRDGIESALTLFVPLADPIKVSRLTLTNHSSRARQLSVTTYSEWVLGTQRGPNAPFITTETDVPTGAILARNSWGTAFPGRVAFADLGEQVSGWTTDRTEFLGRNGSSKAPLALTHRSQLSKTTGAGLDPCAAQQVRITIAPGQSIEIVSLLGQTDSPEAAFALIKQYRAADLDAVLADIEAYWSDLLGIIEVQTPDRAMDIMLNGWLLYQTLACRITARSAFYQASGAYGFRDQLQDGMALAFARPAETRHHILRAAGRQFVEGDVQHWWLPHSGQGVRTRISDDRVWLAFVTATYVAITDDAAILDESVPFLEGQHLVEGEHDAFFIPQQSEVSGSLFEHCARGLDQAIALKGKHGLPLIGTGDWNDGMNRVGEGGKGESVWLGWLLVSAIDKFVPLALSRDPKRAKRWQTHSGKLREALERHGWDGEWYRRATFDDGTWLGSSQSDECRIDSIAQSWAVLSGAADPARATMAMASLEKHLIRKEDGLALLFTPPFDATTHDPGYIKGYPPGLRENGGQYSHAAMWAILAFAKLGDGDKAHDLFAMLNPVNHASSPQSVERYKVEPYVVAADVYSVAPNIGRGGWTWYTGSAGWMYRAGIEGILGISRQGDRLIVAPVLPAAWPGFEATVRHGSSTFDISVSRATSGNVTTAKLDGVPLRAKGGNIEVDLDGGTHTLAIALGRGRGTN